jgi:hypothetical protein
VEFLGLIGRTALYIFRKAMEIYKTTHAGELSHWLIAKITLQLIKAAITAFLEETGAQT